MKINCKFFIATIALILFGVFCQFLCDYLGYDTESSQYIIGIVISAVVGLISYIILISIRAPKWLCRIFQALAIVLILGMTILLTWSTSYQYNGKTMVIGNGATISVVDSIAEKDRLIEATRFFGRGNDIYRFEKETLPPVDKMDEMLAEPYLSLSLEKAGAYSVFGDYRNSSLLYVLNYSYGFWISLVGISICTVWLGFGLTQCLRLDKLGNKLMFLSCWLFFANLIIGTFLDVLGIHLWTYVIPIISFYLSDILVEFVLLGVMFAIVKIEKNGAKVL